MSVLVFFAFVAGIVTVLSPCILPVLPIVLSGTAVGGKKYPLGVVAGFVLSFTFFTLFLTSIVSLTGISGDTVRYVSVVIIFLFGLVLVIPRLKNWYQMKVSQFGAGGAGSNVEKTGFGSGILVGLSLGLVWTPCVGPILASVIALALSGTVSGAAVAITLAYALGTALPMLAIMYGGRGLLQRVPWLLHNLDNIQKFFGILLIVVAVAMTFGFDRKFQAFILEKFPNYGVGLTKIEDNQAVQDALNGFGSGGAGIDIGMPMGMDDMSKYPLAPEVIPSGEWFNSEPLTLEELRGKVVLVDFWTYSCINCIRTLPYLRDWYDKYEDDGFVILGVHTPEFEFEKDPDNLAKAIDDFNLKYPIFQDNDYRTWRAYSNRYWPAKYLVDANGKIRYTHFGEGDYDEIEEMIQKLLEENGAEVDQQVSNQDYENYSATPETYLGYARISGFASPEGIVKDDVGEYTFPAELKANQLAYQGQWFVEGESALGGADGKLRINFEAKKVFLVMNPVGENPGKVEVYLDGELVGDFAGENVKNGVVTVDSDRLYNLIEMEEAGRHLLELRFDGSVEVFAFTFG